MKRKALSLFLALAMCLTMLPAPAWAAAADNQKAEVTIGDTTTQYTDIEQAFTAAQNAASATIKLLANVTVKSGNNYNEGIALTQGTITLDLNGKTIDRPSETTLTSSDYTRFAVFRLTGGSLTIQDTSSEKTGKISQPDGLPAVSVRQSASLTVTGGAIENTNSEDLRGEYSNLWDRNCAVNADGSANVTITGGALKGLRGVVLGGGSLAITGGDISGTTGNALSINNGSAALSGGTFTSNDTHSIWVESGQAADLLAEGCSYIGEAGAQSSYSSDGKGVVGNTTVNAPVKNTVSYIDADGTEKTREDFTEITADTAELTSNSWYAVKADTTVSSLSVSGTANLILCDGATLTVSGALTLAEGAALHLYFQSGGTGKLAAATVTGKPDAPAGEMKQTTGDGSTTFEKCSEHDWGYTDNGDTHTAQCKLCNTARTAAHSFGEWQSANETTHARTCVCGKTETADHSMTYVANKDGNTHSGTCSACGYKTADAAHTFGTDGSCTVCSARFVAQVGDTQYVTLTKAIEKANGADITLLRRFGENVTVAEGTTASIILGEDDGGASYWIADRYGAPLIMRGGSVTLKSGALSQGIIGAPQNANTAISLSGGTLTIEGTVTKIQGTVGASSQQPAIWADGGTLDLQGNTILDGGLAVRYGAAVKDGLKCGIFINSMAADRVSVEGSSTYTSVFNLLAKGYTFAKYENSTAGAVIEKTDAKSLNEDVIVIECPHKDSDGASLFDKNDTCTQCGYHCEHTKYTNGVCDICGYACPHKDENDDYTLDDNDQCTTCHAQMAVMVQENDASGSPAGDITYYARTADTYGDTTLKTVFDNVPGLNSDDTKYNGSTVTLLTDDLLAYAFVSGGKVIYLDLNGKRLIDSGGGITVGSTEDDDATKKATTLYVIGTAVESGKPAGRNSDYGDPYTFHVTGGTLQLGDGSHQLYGTISTICVKGGKLTTTEITDSQNVFTVQKLIIATDVSDNDDVFALKDGRFDKITVDSSKVQEVTLGYLLEKGNGKAFKRTSGDEGSFVPYDTKITSGNPVEGVTIAVCPHTSIENNACAPCGQKNIVAIVTKNDGSGSTTLRNDSNTEEGKNHQVTKAFWTLEQDGGTLQFLIDAALTGDVSVKKGKETYGHRIDLNGFTITGGSYTLTLGGSTSANERGDMTIQDTSEGKKGIFNVDVEVKSNCDLKVEGVQVGKITAEAGAKVTLKAGTTFTGYHIPSSMTLADWLEDGCCVVNTTDNTVVDVLTPGTGSMISGNFEVRKIPATITASTKIGNVEYGKDVPASLRPTVTVTDNSSPTLRYSWRYKAADGSVVTLPSTTPNAGETLNAYCVITATDASGSTLWATVVKGYQLTVNKAASTVTAAPTAVSGLTYTGGEQALVTAGDTKGGTMVYSLEQNGTYSAELPKGKDAKAYTVWYKVKGDNNHNDSAPASVSVTIAPMTISNVPVYGNLNALVKEYDGTTAMSSYTFKITGFYKTADNTEDANKIALTQGTDFTVDAKYAKPDAGKNIPVEMKFTLKSGGNYVFADNATSATYTAADGHINQSDAPTRNDQVIFVANKYEKTYTVDLKSLLPVLDAPRGYGAVTYGDPAVALDNSYYTSGAVVENGKLNLPINSVESDAENQIGTITMQVSSTNYHDFTMTITVKAVNKIPLEGTPTLSKTAITYGDKLSSIALSSAMKDGETLVAGTFAWTQPDAVPAAGSYTAEWNFTPDDGATYMEVAGTAAITVNKATPTGAPKYTAIATTGKTLADAALAVNDSWPAGTVKWADGDGKDLSVDTEVTANTAYKWVFTPADSDNYNSIEGSVTPYPVSSGGSSGSSGGAATETEKNPDGSTTTTVTDKKTGTVTETTKHTDGSTTVVETKKDGTVTETNKTADGSTGTVVTDKNGNTTAEAKISDKAVSDAKKSDAPVKVSAEVKPGEDSRSAPTVKIDLPKDAGKTKMEIPVKDVTPGTVAVLVKADGTEEIVKTSIPTGDGIRLTVDGDVTVKIVDNAKDFTDTRGHWAEASIDFATSHELFSGTSATTFAPNSPMTRAMLMTVLARFDGEDTTGGAVWYEKSMVWAKENRISDGSNPNGNITREQLVTMLWRYAGSPAGDGSLSSYKDSAGFSSYAVEAMRWAVGEGLISGTGDGMLAPRSNATRAQVATILQRFCEQYEEN